MSELHIDSETDNDDRASDKGSRGMDLTVTRYSFWSESTKTFSGDYLRVGCRELGETRSVGKLEIERAETPLDIRRMFYTGSSYGAEILALVDGTTPTETRKVTGISGRGE